MQVHEAVDGRLRLSADGPVGFDVRYDLAPAARGSEVRASVCVRPNRGLAGRLMAEATNALLAAGALQAAVSRLAREATAVAETPPKRKGPASHAQRERCDRACGRPRPPPSPRRP